MTISIPIADMTSAAIRARLGRLEQDERAHAARDLDAELAQVVLSGGDAEAIEEKHLETERAARRLRAERIALQTALPGAMKREGLAELEAITVSHAETAKDAAAAVGDLERTFEAFKASVLRIYALQEDAQTLTENAYAVAQSSGAPMPSLGNFKSERINAIARNMLGTGTSGADMWVANLAWCGFRGVHIGNQSMQQVLD